MFLGKNIILFNKIDKNKTNQSVKKLREVFAYLKKIFQVFPKLTSISV
jgi:hypothetical protein